MSKKLLVIRAYNPFHEISHTLYYESIEEAMVRNPHLRDFRKVGILENGK